MDTTRLNLTLSTPVIPKENILLIVGIHDLFAAGQPYEELWQKWDQPEICDCLMATPSGQLTAGLDGPRPSLGLAPRWKPDKYSIPRDNSRRDKGTPHTLEDFKPMLAEQLGLEIVATNLPVENAGGGEGKINCPLLPLGVHE